MKLTTRKLSMSLTLAFSLFAAPAAFAEEEEFYFGFDDQGKVEIDGEPFKERGPVTTFLFTEVEKSLPSPDGNVILYLKPTEFRQPNKKNVAMVDAIQVTGDAKPFAHDSAWKMFDAEGQPTDDPRVAFRVLMPAPTEGDAMAFDTVWKECEGNITGNFNGYPCSNRRGLADDYAAYLKVNLLECIDAGLAKVGGGKSSKVHLVHNGTVADSNHSSKSLHAAGRAIDVNIARVTTRGGGVRDFVFSKASRNSGGVERQFYTGLRQCWHQKQVKRRCPLKQSSGGTGTIGWEDRRHQHHLHISMPFCPNNRGHFITEDSYIREGMKQGRVPASKKK